jgi:hypothetical protein
MDLSGILYENVFSDSRSILERGLWVFELLQQHAQLEQQHTELTGCASAHASTLRKLSQQSSHFRLTTVPVTSSRRS